jgi:hypothetical protein
MAELHNWKGELQTFVAKNLKNLKIDYTSTCDADGCRASVSVINVNVPSDSRSFRCVGFHGSKKLAEAEAAKICLGTLSQESELPIDVIDWKGQLQSFVVKTFKDNSLRYRSFPHVDGSFGCCVSILKCDGTSRISYDAEGGPFTQKIRAETAAAKRCLEALRAESQVSTERFGGLGTNLSVGTQSGTFVTRDQLYQIGTSISSVTSYGSEWSRSDFNIQEADLHGDIPAPFAMTMDIPAPSAMATDMPAPFPMATDMPAPSAMTTDMPAPFAMTTDMPAPSAMTTDMPAPFAMTTDMPAPFAMTTDMPAPFAMTTDIPAPSAMTTDMPAPSAMTTDMPAPSAMTTDMPAPFAMTTDMPAPSAMTTDSNVESLSNSKLVDLMNSDMNSDIYVVTGDRLASRTSPLLRCDEDDNLLDFGDPSEYAKSDLLSSLYPPSMTATYLHAFASLPTVSVMEFSFLTDAKNLSVAGMCTRSVETDVLLSPAFQPIDLCASSASMGVTPPPPTFCASSASMGVTPLPPPPALCASSASMGVTPPLPPAPALSASSASMGVTPLPPAPALCASSASMDVTPLPPAPALCASSASMGVTPPPLPPAPALSASSASMGVTPLPPAPALCVSRASGLTTKVQDPVGDLVKLLLPLKGKAVYTYSTQDSRFISTVTVTFSKGESIVKEGTSETNKAAARKSASSLAIKVITERERIRGKFEVVHCHACDAELGPIAEFFFMCKSENDVSFASVVAINKKEKFKLEIKPDSKIKFEVHCVSCQNIMKIGQSKSSKEESVAIPFSSKIGVVDTFTDEAPRVALFGYEKIVFRTAAGDISRKKKWNQSIIDSNFSLVTQV